MVIRKLFKFEGAHIVRNCSSHRCRENIHGHSYIVEVFITSDKLDRGYMVMDFVLLDKVKELVDSFDHTYSLWQEESDELKTFVYKYNRRVAEIPVSPSAEGYALLFFYLIDKILQNTEHKNGEGNGNGVCRGFPGRPETREFQCSRHPFFRGNPGRMEK